MISDQLRKMQIGSIFFIYFFISVTPLMAFESRDHLLIERLVKNCHNDTQSCEKALLKINNYQKNAAKYKKLSCQTRLLGLEANLIMVMNSNLKGNEAKSMIQAVKEYC